MDHKQFNFGDLKRHDDDLYYTYRKTTSDPRIYSIEHYSNHHNCFEFIQCQSGDAFIKCTLVYGNFTYSKCFYLNNYVSNSSHQIVVGNDPPESSLLILYDQNTDKNVMTPFNYDGLKVDIHTFFNQTERMTNSYFNSHVETLRK